MANQNSYITFFYAHKNSSSELLIEDVLKSSLDDLEYIGRSEDKINLKNDSKKIQEDFRRSKDLAIFEFNL
mgnify:CR=1 FL=1